MSNKSDNELTRHSDRVKSEMKEGVLKSFVMVAVALAMLFLIHVVRDGVQADNEGRLGDYMVFLYIAPTVIFLFAIAKMRSLGRGKKSE